MTALIAPSILSADFGNLRAETIRCHEAGADWIHFDVMDGVFVPNITIGAPVIKAVRSASKLPFDVHLMIERPDRHLDAFLAAGADIVTIHVESPCDIGATLARIRAAGKRAGISLRPGTPLAALDPFLPALDLILVMSVEPGFGGQAYLDGAEERIRSLADRRRAERLEYLIEVDGGINAETGQTSVQAGAEILVAGNYLFCYRSLNEGIKSLR
jgi:ribulose-phosphate 3-epimerase